jgi:hypothetical protein
MMNKTIKFLESKHKDFVSHLRAFETATEKETLSNVMGEDVFPKMEKPVYSKILESMSPTDQAALQTENLADAYFMIEHNKHCHFFDEEFEFSDYQIFKKEFGAFIILMRFLNVEYKKHSHFFEDDFEFSDDYQAFEKEFAAFILLLRFLNGKDQAMIRQYISDLPRPHDPSIGLAIAKCAFHAGGIITRLKDKGFNRSDRPSRRRLGVGEERRKQYCDAFDTYLKEKKLSPDQAKISEASRHIMKRFEKQKLKNLEFDTVRKYLTQYRNELLNKS